MSRFVDPITDKKTNGSLRFFESGTNTTLVTYKDELETLENPTIVPVLPNGNVENVFFSGAAKVVYLDEFDVQYAVRDPVGSQSTLGDFNLWEATVIYGINDIVEGSNGNFYQSLANGNVDNDPTSADTSWKEIRFIGVWNTNVPYSLGDIVQSSDGNLWKAITSTTGDDPSTDDGTNWLPAIDGVKVPEVITLESRTTTVIPQTVSGELTALRVNELQDGGGFDIPLANTVDVDQIITITQPDEFISFEPVITTSGSDTITDSDGTDTSITFDNIQSVEIILTSDGVSDWRL